MQSVARTVVLCALSESPFPPCATLQILNPPKSGNCKEIWAWEVGQLSRRSIGGKQMCTNMRIMQRLSAVHVKSASESHGNRIRKKAKHSSPVNVTKKTKGVV